MCFTDRNSNRAKKFSESDLYETKKVNAFWKALESHEYVRQGISKSGYKEGWEASRINEGWVGVSVIEPLPSMHKTPASTHSRVVGT
jgi:hypothetical protein